MLDSVKYWTGLRPMTPSNVPLIGKAHLGAVTHGSHSHTSDLKNRGSNNKSATFDNLWLNTGHGTLGWTHSCGSAKAISLLIQGQKPEVDFAFVGE